MDDEFEELLCGNELLNDSSQGSLTAVAANLTCVEPDREDSVYTIQDRAEYPGGLSQLSQLLAEDDHDASIPSRPNSGNVTKSNPNADAITKIESVFEQVADTMLNEKNEISITLKTRQRVASDESREEHHTRRISFPGRNANEAWRFGQYPAKSVIRIAMGLPANNAPAVVIRILEVMHEALLADVVISKRLPSSSNVLNDAHCRRDIYYRDPALFGSQTHVDRYVDDIACTFGITRTALNVTAVAKGLVAGAMTFCRRDGSTFTTADDQNGILVPALKEVLSVDMSAVRWVLVVEKEATFRSIAASTFWDQISTEGVVITGKGYPDLASRALLHFLTTASPGNGFASPPVYGLADYDPDGVAILSTYKHGSKALAHESEGHSVRQLQWLGIRSGHLLHESNDSQAAQGIMMLTPRDRRKAVRMVQQESSSRDSIDAEWSAQLKRMLMLNMRAELQLLDALPGGMIRLLETMRGEVRDRHDGSQTLIR